MREKRYLDVRQIKTCRSRRRCFAANPYLRLAGHLPSDCKSHRFPVTATGVPNANRGVPLLARRTGEIEGFRCNVTHFSRELCRQSLTNQNSPCAFPKLTDPPETRIRKDRAWLTRDTSEKLPFMDCTGDSEHADQTCSPSSS